MDWSEYIPPLHPQGRLFVAGGAAATLLFWLIGWGPLAVLALIATLFMVFFFRDPHRYVPDTPNILVAPADGRIQAIANVPPPPELEMGEQPCMRISIFLSVLDVHVNRAPDDATVERAVYVPGKFVNAALDKASEENERQLLRLKTGSDKTVGLALIAGLVARRIVCDVDEGEELLRGERIGIIRFGSRADIYLDSSMKPVVAVGQRVYGGETVIASAARGAKTPAAIKR